MGEVEESGDISNKKPAENLSDGSNASSQPTSISPPFLHVVPYSQDPLDYLAQLIVDHHRSRLPDLTPVIVLLSQSRASPWFRRALLQATGHLGIEAVLGPQIDTLTSWVDKTILPNTNTTADETLELMLVEALLDYPDLYGQGSPYGLAASLMGLFTEMTEYHVRLPDTPEQFQQQLELAYGTAKTNLSALSKEATLVHTLWQAMHRQLESMHTMDSTSAYIKKLSQSVCNIPYNCHFYVAGFHDFNTAEWQWLETVSKLVHVTIVIQGDKVRAPALLSTVYTSANALGPQIIKHLQPNVIESNSTITVDAAALTDCINRIYDATGSSLQQRTLKCAADFRHDPIGQHLRVYEAASSEAEAHAVEIQVRRWMMQGLSRIAIVTENRRLARRLRALLERAGIILQDAAGWALSTTSAATVVERWLQCIEEDFHYIPFLDFLKSPFVFTDQDRQLYLQSVYQLEKSIIIDENIAAGMERYQLQTSLVHQRLSGTMSGYLDSIPLLLDRVAQTAQPLRDIFQNAPQTPGRYLQTLLHSLQLLGVVDSLRQDAAGSQVLNLFDKLINASRAITLPMNWAEFRAWLGGHLEHALFQPSNTQGTVQLMSLSQSDLQQFDALIIAGAEQQFLPGAPSYPPFFNDAVRANLGIPTVRQNHARQFYYFRRLLQSTQETSQHRLLITWTSTENDEELIPSPWLEAIQSFHALAYKTPHDSRTSLQDWQLKNLVEHGKVQWCDQSTELPEPVAPHPKTSVHSSLIPKTMSASSYQQLINCPYQFFAARCLRLSPPETVREMLQKDEYGSKVHLCLQAFHSDVNQLPGPFKKSFNEGNKQAAIQLLQQISRQVFAKDIEDNFIHRGWLKRWEELIPQYVQWQIEQVDQWRIFKVEVQIKNQPLFDMCKITGQLDRIDENDKGFNIIDYKTGKVPSKEDVTSGEAVQLPFYAMLAQALTDKTTPAERVEYLSLDKIKFGASVFTEGVELSLLQHAVAQRLADIMQALHNGQELPAWGDSHSCKLCTMNGLCRKGSWSEPDSL